MLTRKPISKKKRFDVFKRDAFRCVYCGATPLTELLHIDHIKPVVDGGTNDIDNLCTACIPCNQGKGGRSLTDIPQSLSEKATQIAEQEEQLLAYQAVMTAKRDRIIDETWDVIHVYDENCDSLARSDFESIRRFVEKLGIITVTKAMETAASKGFPKPRTFKYFYGVCWNLISSEQADA